MSEESIQSPEYAAALLKLSPIVVEKFADALSDDLYPAESIEKIFGVEMRNEDNNPSEGVSGFGIGQLTYNAWLVLWINGFVTKDELIDALWEGKLPQIFEEKVNMAYERYLSQNKDTNPHVYMTQPVQELIRRGFTSIPWDVEMHQKLAVKKIAGDESALRIVLADRIDSSPRHPSSPAPSTSVHNKKKKKETEKK
mmetsp:Transcript_23339/g.33487  ORF Transcript_23339/g.33487 Transcript_23339/m.33487 type:complete len:197 (+) Transcript_23339:41-631(+)